MQQIGNINVLNIVNFGGGSYVLYAEVTDDGRIVIGRERYAAGEASLLVLKLVPGNGPGSGEKTEPEGRAGGKVPAPRRRR